MNQTRLEISVGAFVIVGFAAIAYLALKIGAGLLVGTDTYLVNARFGNVAGLNPGGKIAIAGVTVGSIEAVTLDAADFSAVVTLRLRSDVKLPADTVASVRANGLLGDKFLQLRPGVAEKLLAAGETLAHTESSTDLMSAVAQFTGGGGAVDLPNDGSYLVRARFNNITGLTPGCRVAISGVTVGAVEDITLNLEDFTAIVQMRVRNDVKLPLDTMVAVKSSSLIGGKFLALQLGADDVMVAAGGMLTETQSTVDLESLISRFAFGSLKNNEEEKSPAPAP